MSVQGNGQPIIYEIAVSGALAARIKYEQRTASQDGRGQDFLNAMRRAITRLRRAPRDLGESVFALRKIKLVVQIAFLPPVALEFGVHDDLPMVYLRRVKYVPRA